MNAASPLVLVLQPHNKTGDRSFTCSIRSKFYSLLLVVSNWHQSVFKLQNQASGNNGSARRHKVLSDTATDLWSSQMYPGFYLPCRNATSRTDDEMSRRQRYHAQSICENYQSYLLKTEVALQMMQSAGPGFRNFVRLLKWIEREMRVLSLFSIQITL